MGYELEARDVTLEALPLDVYDALRAGGRLAAVVCRTVQDGFAVRYVLLPRPGADAVATELTVRVPSADPRIPSLAGLSFASSRFEREVQDLFGVRPEGHPIPRRLVAHAHWPLGWAPMTGEAAPALGEDVAGLSFTPVEGPGVSEIAVGPVHAGIIEPGHFRFTVVGETIVQMEPRFWFLHRGAERAFEGRTPQQAITLAEHLTGDAVVGHTLAFAQAVESAAGMVVPEPARLARAMLLELERLVNHASDLGALANDTGFGIANVHAGRLRERLLREHERIAGHRFLRGTIRIGGVRIQAAPDAVLVAEVADELAELARLVRGHGIVRDRLTGTGTLPGEAALALGTVGVVARASGIDLDLRRDAPEVTAPADFAVCLEQGGDVLARFLVREREAAVSARLVTSYGAAVGGALEIETPSSAPAATTRGIGTVESWRGAIVHHVELDDDGLLRRVKAVDPSFFNWPALPVALRETIVPDFPLTNKSFNLSYAGNDL